MPLESADREKVHDYCVKDLPGNLQWHIDQFAFIADDELKKRLGRAFYAARYVAKLMEALLASGDEIHAFIKFQVIQYASIYEAVISYLLWKKFASHPEVISLETHKAYKPVAALGKLTTMSYGDEELFPCVYRDSKTPRNSIPFKDKVDCGIRIGFIDASFAEDIKQIYALRNLAHIETEAEKEIELELENAKKGYWRIKPFLERISEFCDALSGSSGPEK